MAHLPRNPDVWFWIAIGVSLLLGTHHVLSELSLAAEEREAEIHAVFEKKREELRLPEDDIPIEHLESLLKHPNINIRATAQGIIKSRKERDDQLHGRRESRFVEEEGEEKFFDAAEGPERPGDAESVPPVSDVPAHTEGTADGQVVHRNEGEPPRFPVAPRRGSPSESGPADAAMRAAMIRLGYAQAPEESRANEGEDQGNTGGEATQQEEEREYDTIEDPDHGMTMRIPRGQDGARRNREAVVFWNPEEDLTEF